MPPIAANRTPVIERARQVVAGVYGGFLGLALVKFGNPVILDHLVDAPDQRPGVGV